MDYLQAVTDKENELAPLYKRNDADRDLLYLARYVMKDAGEKHKVPNIVNVTLNRPAVFAANVIAALGSTSEQIIVESEDKKLKTKDIEDFQRAGFASANARLRMRGGFELEPFFDEQACIRGREGARCLFRLGADGKLIADITPWDTRYVSYEVGADGLDWGAYRTTRAKGLVKAEYGSLLDKYRVSLAGPVGTVEVLDVWSTEHNEVWVDKKQIKEEEHKYGFCPVVIQIVTLGSMLADKDSLEHWGESIFFLFRGIIPELNRLASIMQTLNLKSVAGPKQFASKAGDVAPEYDEAMAPGAMAAVETGGGISDVPFGDALRAATLALNLMDTAIQEASLSSADLGLIGSPPASGIRAIIAGEHRDTVYQPRLRAKALMKQQLAEMFTRQVIQIGGSVELGTLGHRRTFQASQLEGEYETTYKYTAKSASVDAGLYSLAAAAGNSVSEKYKAERILQLEDPVGDEKQRRMEEAERLSPAIKIYRTIKALSDMGEDFEAALLAAEMDVNVDQMLAGDVGQQPKPQKEDEPTQVLSLFGGGGGGGGRQPGPREVGE